MDSEEDVRQSSKCLQKLCYGLGHVYNDLCAAMWFSYTLFYLQIVLQIESKTAGILVMIGQTVDSLATPASGWALDRTGSRRAWHLTGTFMAAMGFTLLYCVKNTMDQTYIYYGLVISLFQIGWALTQISHLSIIPEIASSHTHSFELTNIRYSASVCCSIFVYVVTLFILKDTRNPNEIGPEDFNKFKEIVIILTLIGVFSTLIFYCGALTKNANNYQTIPEERTSDSKASIGRGDTIHFLKSPIIYKVSLMYMASRLYTTLTLIYIPLYLDELGISGETKDGGDGIRRTIASVPLVCFLASFLASIFFKYTKFSHKVVYLSGILLALGASIWIRFGISLNWQLYIIAVLIGVSGSTTMVSSLCLTAEFVQINGYRGASVYSTVTFTDKLISGGVVFLVQNLQCESREKCTNFYQNVLFYLCVVVSSIGLISLISLRKCNVHNRDYVS